MTVLNRRMINGVPEYVYDTPKTYVLLLEDGFIYVGYTKHLTTRLKQHRSGAGAVWTKLHKPVSVLSEHDGDIEKDKTLEMFEKYGREKVRGYVWVDPTDPYREVYDPSIDIHTWLGNETPEPQKDILSADEAATLFAG